VHAGDPLTEVAVGIHGVDIHPRFQAAINIEEVRREGFDFMAVKVSEGTDGSYLAAGWDPYASLGVAVLQFTDRAQVAGQLVDADHYRGTR
jgi:hypothetical protein